MSDDARLQVVLEAKIDNLIAKLGQANSATATWAKTSQQHIDDTDDKFSHLFGHYDPGVALERIFDSSRLKILDSGIARIGLFGSALQDLGPIGIAAAAGVAVLGAAVSQAIAASKWSDEIEVLASKLGITTTSVQKLEFALQTIGVAPEQASASLQRLNQTLGQLQENEPRSKQILQELGFTSAQIESFKTVDDFIPALADHVKSLGSAAEQSRVLERLGIADWAPLLDKGSAGFVALADEAQKAGIILDQGFIQKAADANEKMASTAAILQGSLRRAFIDLAPAIITVLAALEPLLRDLGDFIEGFKTIDARSSGALQRQRTALVTQSVQLAPSALAGNGAAKTLEARNNALISSIDSELAKRVPELPPANGPPRANIPTPPKRVPGKSVDASEAEAQKTLDEAIKTEASARAAMTQDIIQQAVLEQAANNDELKTKNDSIDAQIKQIETDKKILPATAAILVGKLNQAKQDNENTADLKNEGINIKLENTLIANRLAFESQITGYVLTELQVAQSLAKTATERRDIALQILQLQQDEKTAALNDQIRRGKIDHSISDSDAQKLISGQQSTFDAQQKQVIHDTMGPLEAWKDQAIVTADQIDEAYQKVEVNGLNSLTDGITAAITQTKTLGDAFHDVALSIISDLVKIAVQKNITQPLAGLLGLGGGGGGGGGGDLYGLDGAIFGGSAIGTDFSPGGPTIVGENGPELLNLPKGSQVVPNGLLKSLATLSTPRASPSAGGPINLTVQVDASDSVLTDTVQGWVAAGVQQAIVASGQRVPTIVSDSLRRRIIQR